ncbi:MAG: nicotinamide mononucleotide transporter family protein [Intrasporangiaceae bacterium]|nr:nicotinamide mononucleotide transporter family protein [Intrasporangiaceae bacterium]
MGEYRWHWLELIGVLIGIGSAYLGMKRWVWAWPVGIIANVMLFFVYLGAMLGAGERIPLFGHKATREETPLAEPEPVRARPS